MGLTSVIMLGLLLMFNQTQRVFTASMTQVDVLEAGRAATEQISREMEQITPSYRFNTVNFFTTNTASAAQPLPGRSVNRMRTNVLDDVFFLTRENQTWIGIGYRISLPASGVGALYRYEARTNISQDPAALYNIFINTNRTWFTNMSRVMDGVVHFKVSAFNTNGIWIRSTVPQQTLDPTVFGNTNNFHALPSTLAAGEVGLYVFISNSVPASLEFELAILESRRVDRIRSMPTAAIQRQFLTNQIGAVHVFRQRVNVRNVDPTAYQ